MNDGDSHPKMSGTDIRTEKISKEGMRFVCPSLPPIPGSREKVQGWKGRRRKYIWKRTLAKKSFYLPQALGGTNTGTLGEGMRISRGGQEPRRDLALMAWSSAEQAKYT